MVNPQDPALNQRTSAPRRMVQAALLGPRVGGPRPDRRQLPAQALGQALRGLSFLAAFHGKSMGKPWNNEGLMVGKPGARFEIGFLTCVFVPLSSFWGKSRVSSQ